MPVRDWDGAANRDKIRDIVCMDSIVDFLRSLYTTEGLISLIRTGGLVALVAIVFAETGLLIGFFLPGDSLLVTAGILSSPHAVGGGIFDPVVLIVCLCLAAIAGDQVNFALGRKAGHVVFSRPDDRFIKRRRFQRAGIPDYWAVDLDARAVDRWRPSDERPETLDERLEWHPTGAVQPLELDLPILFDWVWGRAKP